MTDETVLDGNQTDAGEKASQAQSSTSSGQPSADVTTLQKEIDELKKLYNGIKKSEDKINSRVEERVNSLTSNIGRITELAKAGKSQSEIEERLLLDEILQERKGKTSPEQTEGTEKRGQGPVDVQDIARQLNLDVGDTDIAKALESGNIVTVMKVAMSKATTPSPGPEDSPPLLGGASVKQGDVAALQSAYDKELERMRAAGRVSVRALSDLKASYRKKGLNIW